MTKQEFEELIGGKVVTDEAFHQMNRIYMAIPDMDKQTFCKRVVDHDGIFMCNELVDRIKLLEGMLEERNNELEDCHQKMNSLAALLVSKSSTYADKNLHDAAVDLVGEVEVVKIAIDNGDNLWPSDRRCLVELLNKIDVNSRYSAIREDPTSQESGENAI